MKTIRHIVYIFSTLLLLSCSEPYPRPNGYLRITLPERNYEAFNYCNFSSQKNSASTINPIQKEGTNCWFNLSYPSLKADIHFTYLPVEDNFADLVDHAHKIKDRHNQVASYIPETRFDNPDHNVGGLLFEINGRNAASPINFFLTDSVNHFVLGTLYFNHSPNNDSIQPSINYLKEDIIELMENWEWVD